MEPIFSQKLNLQNARESNKRELIEPHVDQISKSMKIKLKDMEYPIVVCVASDDVTQAKQAAEKGLPFTYSIVVRLAMNLIDKHVMFYL
jgi:predicted DNA binding CopG/RHH family protein